MTAAATTPCPPPWWTDCAEISRLLRWLEDNGGLDVADCIGIVEKPWHWEEEYHDMLRDQSCATEGELAGEAAAAGDGDMITDCDQ